ncbi:MAG: CDP-glycerol glycerophosphotransferase family protein [Ruminococcus sp.]|nr:CDP-glycerol glycerophosphotransferase family protein [Ruminococcus sp.]
MESIDLIEEKKLEEIADRRKAVDKKLSKGKTFGLIKNIEFKRVIFHLSGEIVNADHSKEYGARFVTEDRTEMFYPAHFDVEGNQFSISLNIMCCKNQEPIASGNYYLVIFEKYEGHKEEQDFVFSDTCELVKRSNVVYKVTSDEQGRTLEKVRLTCEYPCFIDPEYDGMCDNESVNPWNFKFRRSGSNLFYAVSKQDMDTAEYSLSVTYKAPGKPIHFFGRQKKYWKEKFNNFKKDKNALELWFFTHSFKLFTKFAKRNGDIILFASGSRAEIGGNEEFIYKRMIERGLDKKYKFRFDFKENINVNRPWWKMLRFAYYLATSDIILIDDYYPEIYKVDYPKTTKILQVWHACGAFKSLGFERLGKPGAPPFNTRVHKCYTHVPVSSYHSAKHHAEGFAIDESKFYPVGIPRTDIFFDEEYKKETRLRMLDEFEPCKTADKVYLYAPTFRGNNAVNAYFPFDKFDLDRWGEFLEKKNAVLIIKMHPFVSKRVEIPPKYKDRILDASDYREVNDILFIIDVLITDYSSIIYETSLLKKPMLFFAFDRKYYENTRDFYEPYEELVPGKIVTDFDELLEAMENEDYDIYKMDSFIEKNFTYTDGKATDRVIDQLIIGNEPNDEQK